MKERLKNIALIGFGNMLYAAGITIFIVPAQFAPGGISGLAATINALTGWPIGAITLAFNLPLILLAARYISKKFVLSTLCAVLVFSFCADVLWQVAPVYTGDGMLAALFGGAVMGVGFGLTIKGGASTGGTDIAGLLILRKYPHLSIGNVLLGFDLLVISTSLLVFRQIESGMYAIICMVVASKIMDRIIYGLDDGKLLLVISSRCEEISQEIMTTFDRSATILTAQGAYSKTPKQLMLSAVDHRQASKAKRMIKALDRDAFALTIPIAHVQGEGWEKPSAGSLLEALN